MLMKQNVNNDVTKDSPINGSQLSSRPTRLSDDPF